MATGVWDENNRPTIPGFYNRFKSVAEKRIGTGIHGIVAMPIKSNWGPVKKVVSIKDEKQLIKIFGNDMNYTSYKLGRLALMGQPKEILLYRLVDGAEKVANLVLKDTLDVEVIELKTKYPTTRNFNISIRSNIIDANKKDIVLFEGSKQLYAFSELANSINELVNSINSNPENIWITAIKKSDSEKGLANIVNMKFENGNDGTGSITNEHYIDAMLTFEGYKADGFCLDGVTDSSLHNSIKAWVKRNKRQGNNIIAFLGGKDTDTIQQANTKSKEFNFEGIVNIGTKGVYEGIKYTPAEVAVYICALATGQRLKESICNQKTIFEDVEPRLTKEEVESCLESGTLVMVKEDDDVIVVDDVNTLKKYNEYKNSTWGYIRAIKFMNAVDGDTSIKRKEFVGKVPNNKTGQLVVICALKLYFEILEKEGVIENFTVEIDEELQNNAKDDEFFWKWEAKYVNNIKRIYGTGYIRE